MRVRCWSLRPPCDGWRPSYTVVQTAPCVGISVLKICGQVSGFFRYRIKAVWGMEGGGGGGTNVWFLIPKWIISFLSPDFFFFGIRCWTLVRKKALLYRTYFACLRHFFRMHRTRIAKPWGQNRTLRVGHRWGGWWGDAYILVFIKNGPNLEVTPTWPTTCVSNAHSRTN